jgi:hypothetical protein
MFSHKYASNGTKEGKLVENWHTNTEFVGVRFLFSSYENTVKCVSLCCAPPSFAYDFYFVYFLCYKEISCSCWQSNPGCPACSPSLYCLSCPDTPSASIIKEIKGKQISLDSNPCILHIRVCTIRPFGATALWNTSLNPFSKLDGSCSYSKCSKEYFCPREVSELLT